MRLRRTTNLLNTLLCLLILAESQANSADDLGSKIGPLVQAHAGQVSIAIKHLSSGSEYYLEADRPMPTASLIKFPVMVEAYRQEAAGLVNFSEPIQVAQEDKVPGSGIITHHFSDLTLSLRDAIELMIAFSDNTATNLVLDQIGIASTGQSMEQLGCPNTKIYARVFRHDTSVDPEQSRKYGLGSTTAREMIRLYEQLEKGQLVSPEACQAMKKHLFACDDATKLKKLLPPETKMAHKTGAVSAVRTDAGLIYSPSGPIAVCVLTSENKDQSWEDDNAAQQLCAQLGRLVYDHFNQGSPNDSGTQPQTLQVGSVGEIVVSLQRTLNHRLKGVSAIAVDGDFGPGTQAAVKAFQRQSQLPETGIVDANTWNRLGPLIGEEEFPEPQVVNSMKLPLAPADALNGPPWVSCTAWAIADAQSGHLIAGYAQDQSLDPASTTKVMTALVVLRIAETQPEILEQVITFSSRADQTTGSTSDVRAGEQLSVRHLLFGLLLPSGNDAAVALAEHCGGYVNPPTSNLSTSYDAFIAEMNRTAAKLGMAHSKFSNPHGLTDPEHKMSASDLVKLTWEAMKYPLIRQIVSTRVYGCTVSSVSGYTRNLKWENTNKLLDTEGYLGVKTGTTSAAGACLVSLAERDGQSRICVVLGSGSSAARYADTRNLLRWSWTMPANSR